MDKLIDKIDSYNIFNYFVPGAVVFEFVRAFLGSAESTDILSRLLLYYLTGLTVSRLGSLVLEPLFKMLKLVTHSDYTSYVLACERDKKIELFVEIANMYRTIYVGALVCLVITFVLSPPPYFVENLISIRIALGLLAILFFLSYRKQSGYVNKRVIVCSRPETTVSSA
ncbi:phosphohistidine phosphatase [Sphingomonas sinipercae]|uniref:Phosphohistidine phosphatase n=1 Tax=Sphingomonas sinipercae TaxID=2714944 RepID=A0A6G7ZP30_9SPHN|nr:phosphohistidine phosphatase [Sphingomonas sinipercae]QIL02693.1 phosphohistidine phosphatase [Sphingomonas sinipercae]